MSKPKQYRISPDWKAAQRAQQSAARAIVKATLKRTPHAEVIDAAPLVEVVFHQGAHSPASFWTDDPQAAERLCELIGDLRRLAVALRFDEGIEATHLTIGGLSRKGKLSPLNHAIERLAQCLQTREWKLILAEIERDCADESDILEDLRAAADDPVRVAFQEVVGERVNFRRTDTGKESSVSVKTIHNVLSAGASPRKPRKQPQVADEGEMVTCVKCGKTYAICGHDGSEPFYCYNPCVKE